MTIDFPSYLLEADRRKKDGAGSQSRSVTTKMNGASAAAPFTGDEDDDLDDDDALNVLCGSMFGGFLTLQTNTQAVLNHSPFVHSSESKELLGSVGSVVFSPY